MYCHMKISRRILFCGQWTTLSTEIKQILSSMKNSNFTVLHVYVLVVVADTNLQILLT